MFLFVKVYESIWGNIQALQDLAYPLLHECLLKCFLNDHNKQAWAKKESQNCKCHFSSGTNLSQNRTQLFHIIKCPWLGVPLVWKIAVMIISLIGYQNNLYKLWSLIFIVLLNKVCVEQRQWLWWMKFKTSPLTGKFWNSGSVGLWYSVTFFQIIKHLFANTFHFLSCWIRIMIFPNTYICKQEVAHTSCFYVTAYFL